MLQQVCILGASGSIGTSTLDVIEQHLDCYQVFAVTAQSRVVELEQICLKFNPQFAVIADASNQKLLQARLLQQGCKTEVLFGQQALCDMASHSDVDIVMAAITGAAGLPPTFAAVKAGKRILLANKEALVMSGALFMDAVKKYKATLLPIDSEHNAIFQCIPVDFCGDLLHKGIRRILLTASGGPFRCMPIQQLINVTPEQACAHPNWSMGRKISVDSATMMNKGLELIEACWLFNAKSSQIEIVVHPQSIIHSMVDYTDGSVLAQLGNPDMRTPIAHALAWPNRIMTTTQPLDLFAIARLDFFPPDDTRFPCLKLAKQAIEQNGTAPAILNAANEIAVSAFLDRQIKFTEIEQVIVSVLNKVNFNKADTLESVFEADQLARDAATNYLQKI